ncbi:hypothetical protein X975_19327, partial [Stegodyphus mimosarum]
MAKLVMIAVFVAFVAVASAASFGGLKDLAGNYYDFSTGQYSSALTGKVYNTAPVAYVPPVAPVAPVVAPASPYYYAAAPYPYSAAYVAPVWK